MFFFADCDAGAGNSSTIPKYSGIVARPTKTAISKLEMAV